MSNWMEYRPKFSKGCILLTASWVKDRWEYNSWLIKKVQDYEDKWYWGWLTIEGEEYGDINDLSADLYKIVNIPPKKYV